MATPPPCRALGPQCRALRLTLRIADLKDDSPGERDALATWLTGHTERISFGKPYRLGRRLVVDATVYVPCKYLKGGGAGEEAHCSAHGYRGSLPRSGIPESPPAFRLNGDRFSVIYRGRRRALHLPAPKPAARPGRALPVLEDNPCAGAPCRTADNKRGAACCRDLTLEVLTPKGDRTLELLLRSRRSPYLCKVSRESADIIECEVISACGYLDSDGVSCVLHGRLLPDGEPAKPFVCTDWPDLDPEHTGHPGCRLI
ncbi:MAG: hypothetical protein KatS3mg081_2779 [Gemmatimonadales bacterium]|nr:MAG: hypothetical protein KatS3mg081_2779 [Gemmatimonadales bacterium]